MSGRFLVTGLLAFIVITSCGQQVASKTFDGKTTSLRGEWNLVMNQFLSYAEVLNDTSAIKAVVPGTWNELIWNQNKIGPHGYGTYYKTISTQNLDISQHLALEVSEIGLSYRVYANGKLIGKRGTPGISSETEVAKINYGIYDFEVPAKKEITIIFHVSNFAHESGGLWYAPNLGLENKVRPYHDANKGLSFSIVGAFLIVALFQLYLFIVRREREKFGLYIFLGTLALVLLIATRSEMILLDFFPNTNWVVLKKTLYISLFLLAPMNGRFLLELFPAYINKNVIHALITLAIGLTLFTLLTHPSVSYIIVPYYHILNVAVCVYLLGAVAVAAYKKVFGARFLLLGYLVAFLCGLHDILVTQYIIPGFSFAMIHIGTIVYILQLLLFQGGRYVSLLDQTQRLTDHLKTVNVDLERKVAKRTEDLSQQNKLIEKKNKELEKALQEKEYLMEVVAHDLKAPFNTIMGISDILNKELEGRTAEFNKMIRKLTLDGRRIVEDMMEVKAFEEGKVSLQIEEVSLKRFFNDKVMSFNSLAIKKGIRLQSKISAPKETIQCDETILTRIADNLLSNAIKFSPPKSTVHFEIHGTSEDITFVISDEGPGFSKEDKEKMFQKFQRLSAKPTGGESSTGLGLSIVKALVDLLKGKIDLSSEEGQGARFVITIPTA